MERRNICKFINVSHSDSLSVMRFILETDRQTVQKPVTLAAHRMILVVEGAGVITCGGDGFDLAKGSLFFAFKGEKAAFVSGDCRYMYIDYDGVRAEELLSRFGIDRFNRTFKGFDNLIPLWEESLSRASEEAIDLVSESMLLYTFSRLSDCVLQNGRVKVMSKILRFAEEQFNNPELSIGAIAEELGYNAKYLSHLFKKKTGKNFTEYLRLLRIKYAVTLMDNGIDSVKNVALLSGFYDPLYFSAVFKSVMGASPTEYIEQNKTQ